MHPIRVMFGSGAMGNVVLSRSAPTDIVADPADATATYQLSNAGAGSSTGEAGWTWLVIGAPGDYEVFATLISGTLTTGTTGSWLPLSTTRSWSISQTVLGIKQAIINLAIRRISDGAPACPATDINFYAEVS